MPASIPNGPVLLVVGVVVVDSDRTSWEGLMAKVASKQRKRAGLTRRMTRSTLRAGMLATAVMVGRKTAGGARTSDGLTRAAPHWSRPR
jgi:hypothetical protein